MSDLTLPIKNGKVVDNSSDKTSTAKKSNDSLGKDDFLQLLVAQMKYQDPLEPASNTEYIAQLATFSELEQMKNLNDTNVNSQAFSLVGQEVIVGTKDSSGDVKTTEGVVDFISISNNKAYMSIGGSLYSVDDLQSVIGTEYLATVNGPQVTKTDAKFDLSNQKDIEIKVDLGDDKYAATGVGVMINKKTIDTANLTYNEGVLTIKKEALKDLSPGKYNIGLQFDNVLKSYIDDQATVTVTDSSKA